MNTFIQYYRLHLLAEELFATLLEKCRNLHCFSYCQYNTYIYIENNKGQGSHVHIGKVLFLIYVIHSYFNFSSKPITLMLVQEIRNECPMLCLGYDIQNVQDIVFGDRFLFLFFFSVLVFIALIAACVWIFLPSKSLNRKTRFWVKIFSTSSSVFNAMFTFLIQSLMP